MPGTWRAHVIAERLKGAGILAAVTESDVFVLEGAERRAVLDAVVTEHADFPMVLVDGVVACYGGIDLGAVQEAAQRRVARADADRRPAQTFSLAVSGDAPAATSAAVHGRSGGGHRSDGCC